MRSRKREAIFMGIGILAGLALSGPTVHAATTITATLSNQPIYVDGLHVPMTAYSIGGNNYVRLRDIGQTMDFAVDYDAAANSVYITSDRPYQQEVTQPAQTTSSPSTGITEESVQASLAELRKVYPDGIVYPTPYRSTSNGPYSRGIHCSGWATLCSDAAFGDLPWRRIERPTWDQIRPGDLVEYKNANAYHVVVVLRRTDEFISVTESNSRNKALWGGQYFMVARGTTSLYLLHPVSTIGILKNGRAAFRICGAPPKLFPLQQPLCDDLCPSRKPGGIYAPPNN